MRDSGFEVSVLRANDNSALPEIVAGNVIVVVAESGSDFKIRVVSSIGGPQHHRVSCP